MLIYCLLLRLERQHVAAGGFGVVLGHGWGNLLVPVLGSEPVLARVSATRSATRSGPEEKR